MEVPRAPSSQGFKHRVKLTDGAVVAWDEGNLVCTCPAGRPRTAEVVSFCRHTERVIETNSDNLVFPLGPPSVLIIPISSNPTLEVEWLEAPQRRHCWFYYLTPLDDSPDLYQVRCGFLGLDIDIGIVHSGNTRKELIEMTIPYVLDWAMDQRCNHCVKASLGGPRTSALNVAIENDANPKWRMSLILYAYFISMHPEHLCPEHHLILTPDGV